MRRNYLPIPSGTALMWVGGWTLLAVVVILAPALLVVWQALGSLLAVLAVADAWVLWRSRSPLIERRVTSSLPMGVWSPVELLVENPVRLPVRMAAHDLAPATFERDGLPQKIRLPGNRKAALLYRIRPEQRGDHVFAGCDVALRSRLGLWTQHRSLPLESRVRVYPNFAEISHFTLLAVHDHLARLGVHLLQRRGSGAEFHQLREYRAGDTLRQIDWKATSRVRKLVSREYQDERDQRLLFLLDCGRRMRHQEEHGRTHLDESLNAMLLLAYIAVRQGDAVGLLTYGGPHRWFAPRKDPDTVNRLLEAVYDVQPSLMAADPLSAAADLMQAVPRRSLVVIITNTRNEDQEGLTQAVQLLRRRHLVIVADLRESILDQALAEPVQELQDALRFHALQGWFEERRHQHERLHHLGVRVLDLIPAQLPPALVNSYFAVKRAGVL